MLMLMLMLMLVFKLNLRSNVHQLLAVVTYTILLRLVAYSRPLHAQNLKIVNIY
jgi:hypothetical protein